MKKEIFLKINELLSAGKKAVLAMIIHRTGSVPRDVGSQCIILEDGTLVGTIGGGLLEYMVIERAKDVFLQGRSVVLPLYLTGKDVAASDMICGGEVEVYLDPLFPENRDTAELFRSIRRMIQSERHGTLLTKIADNMSALDCKGKMLLENGHITGEIDGIMEGAERLCRYNRPRLVEISELDMSVFVEPVKDDPTLFLFGAGHIATFVSPLAKMVGFRVEVIDDRSDFASSERFPDADEIHVLQFSDVFKQITVTNSSYLAIMTRGHAHDKIVLEAALHIEAAYIGMIGSKRKWTLMEQSLIEQGFSEEKIEQVHSPIGINIGDESPEEIAVSILAELIQIRAKKSTRSS